MRTFLLALLVFLPMAALGTQIHEAGHYVAALLMGYQPQLHYGSVSYGQEDRLGECDAAQRAVRWAWTSRTGPELAPDAVMSWGEGGGEPSVALNVSNLEAWTASWGIPVTEPLMWVELHVEGTQEDELTRDAVRAISVYDRPPAWGGFRWARHRAWRLDAGQAVELPAFEASAHVAHSGYSESLSNHFLGGRPGVNVGAVEGEWVAHPNLWPQRPSLGRRLEELGIHQPWPGGSARGFVTAMGPLTNTTIGSLGLLWWWRRRRGRTRSDLSPADWVAALTTLFWSRQLFNLLTGLLHLASGRFRLRGDEGRLSVDLDIPFWTLDLVGGVVALAVCGLVLAWVPRRAPFALGGGLGCLGGAAIWFGWLGPLLLP